MNIRQFRYGSDNFSYLVYGNHSALVIDGGAVESILDFVQQNHLNLSWTTHTHNHPDHTSGTRSLMERSGAVLLDDVFNHPNINLDGEIMQVYPAPGHTDDSVVFHFDRYLISGDTLFNGTIGNCFSGNLDAYYRSIRFLMEFPPDTIVYAGHDYVEYAMSFARLLESDHTDINRYLQSYEPNHVCSLLGDELKVNPYLRFNDLRFIEILKKKGLPVSTEIERWNSVMSLG